MAEVPTPTGAPRRRAARRRAPGAEGARERIMDAAQRLFAERGYDATSTAKIAAAADVPSGLVFYYFATKRDLLMAVIRERAYRGTLPRVVTGAGDEGVEEVLRRAVTELAEIFGRSRNSQMILFREAHVDPELRELAARLVASSTGDLADLLAAVPEVEADADGRAAAARLLISGLLMDNFLRPDGVDAARSEPAVRLLAGALTGRAARPDPAIEAGRTERRRAQDSSGEER
ncbi:TetR/AcrR family transcriptional regulator [Actinoallomurus sp. NBC_01490]|uniref:TetR/AcrR family transcriptional regulator n=1 Tax=Actinoallomurus sp. NBC_01490 TaxID=2903557 RepID=UPI002E2FEB6F|nr:helix-turn-helix domain-containing protein [Actinoallomurus sp. NBC_01490]